jgi:putative oxidoreductase
VTLNNPLPRFEDQAYSLLRIVAGAMFLCHGLQKVLGTIGGQQAPAGSQFWIGGLIELFCGAAIALGLLTSLAAFLASGG